jgi:2-polyprenyl-3-methyl-5-hydroxy-6-metoxy-1,4-benzoquinol methylase
MNIFRSQSVSWKKKCKLENKYDLSWEEVIFEINNSFSDELRKHAYDNFLTLNLQDNCNRYHKSGEFKEVLSMIKSRLPEAGTLLDYYAGNGIASYAFAKEGFRVTAFEISKSRVTGAKAIEEIKNELDINITGFKEQEFDFPENSFDVIFSRGALHHLNDIPDSLKKLFRVLKAGGIAFFMNEYVVDNFRNTLKKFNSTNMIHSIYGKENAYKNSFYVKHIKESGFHIMNILKDDINNSLKSNILSYIALKK